MPTRIIVTGIVVLWSNNLQEVKMGVQRSRGYLKMSWPKHEPQSTVQSQLNKMSFQDNCETASLINFIDEEFDALFATLEQQQVAFLV